MDIGVSAPRIYTLETMKHIGTLVVRGMYRRCIISYVCTSYLVPGSIYVLGLHPRPSSWVPRDSDQNNHNDWYNSTSNVRPFIMQDFLGSKMDPFHQRKKHIILRDSKRSSFIADFCLTQVCTATLIIQSFRMIKARGCKQRCKSDLLRNYLVPGTW